MNAKKTKTMVFSKTEDKKTNLTIDGEAIEQVRQFKYLGATVTEDGRYETEVSIRTATAKAKFSEMHKLLTSRQISLPLRLRLLNCYVFSIFMYGAETWTCGA